MPVGVLLLQMTSKFIVFVSISSSFKICDLRWFDGFRTFPAGSLNGIRVISIFNVRPTIPVDPERSAVGHKTGLKKVGFYKERI